MKRIAIKVFAIIGGVATLFVIVLAAVAVALIYRQGEEVPRFTILEINLERNLPEYVPGNPIAEVLFPDAVTVRDLVEGLHRAASDERVVALLARAGNSGMGLARLQEVRDAVHAFGESGKPAVAYAETFGEFGPGNGAYYLATAFDEIYLQPSGVVGLTGLIFESPFIRGMLKKLGVVPRWDHREEYKNAKNFFTEREYTPAHKEATQGVMDSQFDQLVRGIGDRRGLSPEIVRDLFDRGPFFAKDALEAGLIDGLAYRDEVYERVKEQVDAGARFLTLRKYLNRLEEDHEQAETVALIYGVGSVTRGKSDFDPASGETTMGSDTVARAFRNAARDDEVEAILFRVDSPGGSYVASDAIWRETVRAREAGKPVVVSMGDVAGSGGYFVAMAADRIVAQPGTITGSIGVVAGKMLTSGLWEKTGISWDEVHTSAHSTMWTGTRDFSDEEWALFQEWLDSVYEDFTDKVAEGRSLSKERVLDIAKGRIWTGEDARKLGLVDELGGFQTAMKHVREAAQLSPDAELRFKVFPRAKSPWEYLLDHGIVRSRESVAASAYVHTMRRLQPIFTLARRLGLIPAPGVLTMPDIGPFQ